MVEDLWVLANGGRNTEVDLGEHDITNVEKVRLHIGVDADHNHLDPSSWATDHPLAPKSPSMHWGWTAGYRFVALEGHGGTNLNQLVQLHGLGDSKRGRVLFETEYNPFFPEMSGADCAHCHGGANFENDQYMNNGLDADGDFTDIGREEVTGNISDKAKFKTPSLRNVEVTPPYMHDGRLQTLEEVVEHYDLHIKQSSTLDPALIQVVDNGGLNLTEQDKVDLVNFLKTLTDETFLNNPEYTDPF